MTITGSMFRRTVLAFLVSYLVLLLVLGVALSIGYRQSMQEWSQRRTEGAEQAARQILSGDVPRGAGGMATRAGRIQEEIDRNIPEDIALFVYDANRELIATTRGAARGRETVQRPEPLVAVTRDGQTLGYFSVGPPSFRSDTANDVLVESLATAAVVGAIAAIGAAFLVAFALASWLTGPAAEVADGIIRIAEGSLDEPVRERGATEVCMIARAANGLSDRLRSERELRAQWAQDIAHDLRTPVASAKAQLEAIVDGVHEASPERVERTLKELARVEVLIEDLEELTRLEAPEAVVSIHEFSAFDFASSLAESFALEAAQKDIRIVSEVRAEHLRGDEQLLFRATGNLLGNAIRHTPEAGLVTISLHEKEIRVHNQGDPIPDQDLSRVFDRLFRGEYARRSRGSGLGLTIAQRIAELHAGTISVSSSAADGTTFIISLGT
ncbi:MAG: sensor histidine kinase [Spirochaetaceae bacterium]|nr:MAG: sensor histidine kinase [Spirochaetaceae bacterium]